VTTFVSLFSGVGGFDLGLEAAGWECVAQVEWDRDCQAVLARHWPNVPRWADVADAHGAQLPPADVIAFGSPCQDLSVAGQRAGMVEGSRSNLFYEATRIIREMRHATRDAFPRLVIWENVGGALSSAGGRDFAAVLDDLADCGAVDVAWRVLDARWFGVPQRRRRVFVVADFAGPGAGEIHAEPEGVCWHPRTGRQTRQDATDGTTGGAGGRRSFDLSIRGRDGGANVEITEELANALRAGDGGSSRGRAVLTTHTHTPIAFSHNQGMDCQPSHTHTPSLRVGGAGAAVMQPHAFTAKDHGADFGAIAPTLRAGGHTESHANGGVMPAALIGAQVRRLTPVECERLMGWPDDHTRWRADGTEVPDSTRYRMCGNGVASPVAEWLATQLNRALEAHP